MKGGTQGLRVLVTGGAGFIGSHTVDALVADGAHVVIADNLTTGRRENVNPHATFYELNMATERMDEVFERERPDVVYHLGYFVLVPKSVVNPLLDVDSIAGSLRVLTTAARLQVKKVVFSSSGFVYGNTAHLPAGENDPLDPVSPYAVSKSAIENYLRFFRMAYGLPFVVLRYAAVYGPRQVTGAMADYIRRLSRGERAEMWGDGTKTRDYVFISDVVRANLSALRVPDDHPSPVFNVGSGAEVTLNDLYARIARALHADPRPIYHPDRPGEQLRYCLDNAKARRDLGWEPRYSLDEGLKLTIAAAVGSQT